MKLKMIYKCFKNNLYPNDKQLHNEYCTENKILCHLSLHLSSSTFIKLDIINKDYKYHKIKGKTQL